MWSYEFGLDQKIGSKFTFRATAYQDNARDFIYIVTADAAKGIRKWENIGRVRIRGIESEADYRPDPEWLIYTNFTYNQSKIREFKENTALEGKYLPWMPKWETTVGITYSNPRIITARLDGHYAGVIYDDDMNRKKIGEYFDMDLKLSRKITKNIEVNLVADNLTDRHYQQSTYSVNQGRTIMGGLKFTF